MNGTTGHMVLRTEHELLICPATLRANGFPVANPDAIDRIWCRTVIRIASTGSAEKSAGSVIFIPDVFHLHPARLFVGCDKNEHGHTLLEDELPHTVCGVCD